MYNDHELDPIPAEELAEREREAELARRIRREVVRMQRGEADDDLREDAAREAEERAAEEEAAAAAERRERRRRSNPLWLLFTGNILVREGISEYYRYMLCIAGMFFISIVVIFMTLRLDMKFSRLEREVQVLHERSLRLQQERYRRTTHSAILDELRRRDIDLADPLVPAEVIDD